MCQLLQRLARERPACSLLGGHVRFHVCGVGQSRVRVTRVCSSQAGHFDGVVVSLLVLGCDLGVNRRFSSFSLLSNGSALHLGRIHCYDILLERYLKRPAIHSLGSTKLCQSR